MLCSYFFDSFLCLIYNVHGSLIQLINYKVL